MLQTLRSDDLVLPSDNSCVVVSNAAVMEDLNLPSHQEETDRNVILHCENILQRNHGENVWRHIVVLAVGLLQEFNDWFFIVNESGSNTEPYKLNNFKIDIECTSGLLGLHAFTGNDYVLSLFRKGKEKY